MDLPKKFKAGEIEARWRERWEESKVYVWDPGRSREETFVVDTPPPTVSGSLHVGHMFSYSHQDFIVRYQRMRGKNVFFPIGWDDNGLPTERRVQNLYNVKCEPHIHYDPELKVDRNAKGEPRPISRGNFIELCEVATKEDEAAFRHLWSRLGLSYDWDQEYATIDDHCRRISQRSFIDLWEKNEIYHAERPVMWDVNFQTAIAQAEIEDREVPGTYHHLKFAVENQDDALVIATTRPELLPACVAVIVHPEDERYKDVIGKRAITPLFKAPVPIMADEKADPEKGTGVVMVCTFGDQTDVEWWRQFDLPLRQVVGRDGHLLPRTFGDPGWESLDPEGANAVYSQLEGAYVKKAQKLIMAVAEDIGDVVAGPQKNISHAVKFYEKGERPIELVPTRQWYAKIMDKKDALAEQGRKIKWHPAYMETRYQNWVEGLNQDWCLSRQRYFGVPIPVWYKIDGDGNVLYDEAILPSTDSLPVDPLDEPAPGYTEDQRDQPDGFAGDPDILDTWATSSLTPQISSHWTLDPDRHRMLFPADIRPQSHEIIRTWAFYTIAKAYFHEREIPWKHVVISGWILDPDRKKMSKSHGNVVTPEPLIDEFGADSVRYWAARARLGVDTAYDEQVFKVGKRLCTKLFNASKFVLGRFEGIDPTTLTPDRITEETDRAVIHEMLPIVRRATESFEQFDYAQALTLIEEFFWSTFCDNYIELAKPRTYDEDMSHGRLSAATTLRLVHRTMVRLFAPFLPYITEEVWSWAYANDPDMRPSVHKSPWPREDEFDTVPEPKSPRLYPAAVVVIEAVRRAKADAQVSIKTPVPRVTVRANANDCAALDHAMIDISRMLRIEEIDLEDDSSADDVSVQVQL